jgi:hypothetical protein
MNREDVSDNNDKQTSGVSIGDVEGGIHDSIIAGRDVNETAIERLVYNIWEDETAVREYRDRCDVLGRMKRLWITQGLEKSLRDGTLVDPIMELRPDAVYHPWEMVVDTSQQTRELLAVGTQIIDVFNEMERSLLILGEMGSGKTAMLLELARQAIAWAEQDATQPIPVVLDLAWWTKRKVLFADWLVNMLIDKYYITEDAVHSWLENDELLLLLDGLHQVEPQWRREACVEAINEFCQEHGLIPIVVCCRSADYEVMKNRLQLRGAVYLERAYTQ